MFGISGKVHAGESKKMIVVSGGVQAPPDIL